MAVLSYQFIKDKNNFSICEILMESSFEACSIEARYAPMIRLQFGFAVELYARPNENKVCLSCYDSDTLNHAVGYLLNELNRT